MIESHGLPPEKTLPFINRWIGCYRTGAIGEGGHAALRFTPSIMREAETDRETEATTLPQIASLLTVALRIGSQGDLDKAG
jgi:hypothetical protein